MALAAGAGSLGETFAEIWKANCLLIIFLGKLLVFVNETDVQCPFLACTGTRLNPQLFARSMPFLVQTCPISPRRPRRGLCESLQDRPLFDIMVRGRFPLNLSIEDGGLNWLL